MMLWPNMKLQWSVIFIPDSETHITIACRNARKFVAVAGQDCRGDVDSAEAVWQLMAELLVGTAEGMNVPRGVLVGSGNDPPPPVRVLQTKDVKGTCKLLTHISAAMAARLGGELEGGGLVSRQISLEDFNKEARKKRAEINKALKQTEGRATEKDNELEGPRKRILFQEEVQEPSAVVGAGVSSSVRSGVAVGGGLGAPHCDECEGGRATLECAACEQALCADCSAKLHSKGARRAHQLTPLPPPRQCEECEGASAAVSCGECEQALCPGCSAKIHSKGARARHAVTPLNLAAVQANPSTTLKATPLEAPRASELNTTSNGLKRLGCLRIVASTSVYASLRTVELGPGVALEQTSGGERHEGPVEESLYLGPANPSGGEGRAGERGAFWVVLVKGDAFLRGMIKAQVRFVAAVRHLPLSVMSAKRLALLGRGCSP